MVVSAHTCVRLRLNLILIIEKTPDQAEYFMIYNQALFGLSSDTTGDYLILSASLTASTSNQTYLNYAKRSSDFLQQLYQGDGRFWNMIDSRNCNILTDNPTVPYDTGAVVHALSIFAPLTQNTSTMAFIREVVIKSTTYPPWHDGSGILFAHPEDLARLMRGYTEVYKGNSTPSDLKTYLKSYISNQAPTESSTNAGDNAEQLSGQPQVAAISALLSGMALDQDSNPSSSGPSSTVPRGYILGGVMGGIAGIGLLILAIWLYKRGIKGSREPTNPGCVVTPFDLPVSTLDQKSPRAGDSKQTKPGPSSNSMVSNSALPTTHAVDVTTDNLISALGQRLESERVRNGRGWNLNESPPGYPESQRD
ncbi:hypothetical protein V5O48_010122 [Marasmius crinis-equi]|uniref:Glycoside hydrolase family 76 protein n=1 Tax=Marasmius crinis-equi TaxID=585013 RepID=A0ABR3F964_9AGAR